MRLFATIGWSFLILCLAGSASANRFEYTYTGRPFQVNRLPGATRVGVTFFAPTLLSPSTTYGVSSPEFASLSISDGVNNIKAGDGTLLSSDFIHTNASGHIVTWQIVELAGAGRVFAAGQCCTINDPPLILTECCSGPTDASIQTNGFFGIGPNDDYAYNNRVKGIWKVASVPEPSSWAVLLAGLTGLGAAMRLRRKESVLVGP